MKFRINETVKLKSNGEFVDIFEIKQSTLVVESRNYNTSGEIEQIEVPFDAVEKCSFPPVSSYKDHE